MTSKLEWGRIAVVCVVVVVVVAAIGLYQASLPPQRSGMFAVTVAVEVDDADKAAQKTYVVRVMVDADNVFDAGFNKLGDWAPHTEAVDRSWTTDECRSFSIVATLKETLDTQSRQTDLCNGDIRQVRFDFKA